MDSLPAAVSLWPPESAHATGNREDLFSSHQGKESTTEIDGSNEK